MAPYHRAHTQQELIQFARTNSPFYKNAWEHLPAQTPSSIEALPITDPAAYWSANSQSPNETMTAPFIDGCVMRSSGSTGVPKVLYMTRAEQKAVAVVKAAAMAQGCGFVPGDRIAHLSHFGGLYGSFSLFTTALMEMPVPHVHLPISREEPLENTIRWMFEFGATVLLSNPSAARKIAETFVKEGKTMENLRLILYTGESVTKNLQSLLKKAFPNATMYPSLYGSIEAGPVGIPPFPHQGGDDDIFPKYKVLAPLVVMEIINEEGKPIKDNNKRGTVVVTHLLKRQQPVIRYPTGDVASWHDYQNEIFQLHGRDSVFVKITNAQLPVTVLRNAIEDALGNGVAQGSQFVVRRTTERDAQELTLRIVADKPTNSDEICVNLNAKLCQMSGRWAVQQQDGYIAPLQLEWISMDQLKVNGVGKVSDIIDERV